MRQYVLIANKDEFLGFISARDEADLEQKIAEEDPKFWDAANREITISAWEIRTTNPQLKVKVSPY